MKQLWGRVKVENKIKYLATVMCTVILMLMVTMSGYVSKNFDLKGKEIKDISFSLPKGSQTVALEYTSSSDLYLEEFYVANGQEFLLSGNIVPASETLTNYAFQVNMPIAIRNTSVGFRTPQAEEGSCQITSFSIKSNERPYKEVVAIILYIVVCAFFAITSSIVDDIFAMNIRKYKVSSVYALILFSIITFLVFPLISSNIILTILWFLMACLVYYLIIKGKISDNKNAFLISVLLVFSFIMMEVYSTSSPLYPLNMGCDSNIYYSVGSALANGRELYTETFDHKGPAWFFLFELFYIISPTDFYGVWIFEIAAVFFTLYFAFKIANYYLSDWASTAVAMTLTCAIFPRSYFISGASFEEFAIPLILGSLYYSMPYIVRKSKCEYDDSIYAEGDINGDGKPLLRLILDSFPFMMLGLFSSFVFFSKFNVSVVFFAISLVLCMIELFHKGFHKIAGYILGVLVITIPILVYFMCNSGIGSLYHYYFEFNLNYGNIGNISDAVSKIVSNLYDAFTAHRFNSFLILIGLVITCVSDKYFNAFGKVFIPGTFVVLCGTTYPGSFVCNYYYLLPAMYSLWGIIVIASLLEKHSDNVDSKIRIIVACGALSFISLLFSNDFIMSSRLLDRDPRVQEIFAQQMKLYAPYGDTSFFELGFLESGFFPVANVAPDVQFFFYPNISTDASREPYDGQMSYLANAETEYFIWAGCSKEDYPHETVIEENYALLTQFETKNQSHYMLYRRK